MAIKTIVVCDQCGEIKPDGYLADWLIVMTEQISYHLCGYECLRLWAAAKQVDVRIANA